ncbi:MAG: sulfatase-like hydrolase/transferase [Planctomycetota bacterium]|jgi:arylsulfatase
MGNAGTVRAACCLLALTAGLTSVAGAQGRSRIVHDAEYYILYDRHGDKWELEDRLLDAKIAALRKAHGHQPNIIHIMWDDSSFGEMGIPAINKIRGYETPACNRMAEEGIMFTRFYTEPACTPSRAACMTGRHAIRSGMYAVGFPIEAGGLPGEEETVAEVLSNAGYATAFYGKWHLGDIEESYPHNQGFDEALFTPYNQVTSLLNEIGEGANAVLGYDEDILVPDPYQLDSLSPGKGWVQVIEGKKGESGREWGDTGHDTYLKVDPECQKRTMAFVRKNSEAHKPFYVAYWPNWTSFVPNPRKLTVSRTLCGDQFQYNVDAFIGRVMDELEKLGIAENTLLIVNADNGPMSHNPPPGLGMTETIFRGGKGDFWEGGIRVPAFAWWPGVIEPGQIVGDIVHETDLYSTFARLGGATEHIPADRIVDGLDQTALLLNGDTHGRRDYNFVYTGPMLAATIKGRYKRVMASEGHGGIGAATYDLYADTREMSPMLVPMLHANSQFNRIRARHELWKKKYPDTPHRRGVPFTGLANARPETRALANPPVDLEILPFDPLEYLELELPWEGLDPDVGQ